MKRIKELFAAALAFVIMLSAMPLSALASGEVKISLGYQDDYRAEISIDSYDGYYDTVIIEKSADNASWSVYSTEDEAYSTVEINVPYKSANYYRVKLEDSDSGIVSAPSNALLIKSDISEVLSSGYLYTSASPEKSVLFWDIGRYSSSYIDGFMIYESVNGGDFKKIKTLAVDKYYEKSNYSYKYKLGRTAPSKVGYFVQYKIYPYFNFNGKTYSYSGVTPCVASYLSDSCVKVVTKKDKVVIKLKKLGKVNYKISYTPKNIKKQKYGKTKTKKTSAASYTIKNKFKTTALDICVTPYIGSVEGGESEYYNSHEGAPLLRGAGKSKKTKIPVLNVQKKKTKTAWNDSLTAKDKKIIKAFFKKKYGKKLPAREVMAEYAVNWIHNNVKYDTKGKSDKYSYTDAIFNHKVGQCLQYNMATAKVLTYLGYETRLIMGWRGNIKARHWQHFWCEVKINGRWFLVETGNIKDGGWMHFVTLYGDGLGYIKNNKPAKD